MRSAGALSVGVSPLKKLLRFRCLALLAFSLAAETPGRAVEDETTEKERAGAGQTAPTKGSQMIYGPVLSYGINAPGPKETRHVASKGLVIKLGDADEGYVCFDTDTLRMAAGWTGGFLKLQKTNIGTYKGEGMGAAEIAGEMQFRTLEGPGWSREESFTDPRAEKAGPMPKQEGRFKGFYLNRNRVVLSYTVEGCDVLELPWLTSEGGQKIFVRSFTVGASAVPLHLRLAQTGGNAAVGLVGAPVGCATKSVNDHLVLTLPAHSAAVSFSVILAPAGDEGLTLSKTFGTPQNLAWLCKGGPARWPQTIEVKGAAARDDAAYVVDTIPLPEDNPWKSWMRISAFDFFSDGRAAVATMNGDVWVASGLDAKLEKVVWKRFAVGLFEPLGLRIVKDVIYVHGRDQLTRLHDLNGDGEADFYECFNNDRTLWPSYHAFAFDLQTDSKGNFYYVVGGNQLGSKRDWHAALFRVSPDGAKTETVATGFRAPNGMGIGPHDEIAVSDNQGHWIPSSKVNLVKPGGFYGHVADPRLDKNAPAPASFDPPVCYLPMAMDNSSGGQVWVTGGKWGPYEGRMLSTSYGKSALLAVLDENVGGVAQGGAVTLPVKFASGIMRARFNPKDGQLYVAGLKGWQSNAGKDGCFQRVRYTGRPVHLPTALHVGKDEITITFPEPLATEEANDAGNFAIEQYNYEWWSTYGSPELSLAKPGTKGRDTVEVKAAKLSPDGKTVTLSIPGLQPVMQMEIKLRLRAADGAEIRTMIGNTINKLP